jgi:hypothetical protein
MPEVPEVARGAGAARTTTNEADMLKRGFRVFGALLLSAYAWAGFAGWELPSNAKKGVIAAGERSATGFRAYSFWTGGK